MKSGNMKRFGSLRWLLVLSSAMMMVSCGGLEAGWKAQRNGDYAEAQRQAIMVMAREPKNPDVYRLVAATAISQGQYDRAANAADFAYSLDGGTAKSGKLLREALAGKKDWKGLCDAALKMSASDFDEADIERFAQGYEALKNSKNGGGYGCGIALEKSGQNPQDFDSVKTKYAASIAALGHTRDAMAIEETIADESVSKLRVAQRLFALHRQDEAAEKLRAYTEGATGADRELRLREAAEICEDYRQYRLEAEFLEHVNAPEMAVNRSIALKRCLDEDKSDAVLKAYFEGHERTAKQGLDDVRKLIDAGYIVQAVRAYDSCTACKTDAEITYQVADLVADAGDFQNAGRIMQELGESEGFIKDEATQRKLFSWLRSHGNSAMALTAGERVAELNPQDEDFYAELLAAYVEAREIRVYSEKSQAWLKSGGTSNWKRRECLAKIEMQRKNWPGVTELLKPMDEAKVLEGNTLSMYVEGLKSQRQYADLFDVLKRYRPDLDPETRSVFFKDSVAEEQYRQCLEPWLKGQGSNKVQGEILLATFLYDYNHDKEAGREALDRALEASGRSSAGYESVVTVMRRREGKEPAVEMAREWHKAWSQDEKPCTTLGQMLLAWHDTEQAGEIWGDYVDLQENKPQALRFVFQEYARYSEQSAGMTWLENQIEKRAPESEEIAYTSALAASQYDFYQILKQSRDERANQMRAQAVSNYQKLVRENPEKAQSYGVNLGNLEAWEDAAKAYDIADKQGIEWNSSLRSLRLKAALKSGRSSAEIQKILSGAKDSKEVLNLTKLLVEEQHPEYAESILEPLLEDKSLETRLNAYGNLVSIAQSTGDTRKLKKYGTKLENRDSMNPEVRIALADTAMKFGDWDNAVKHLTWLQSLRPDSRDVVNRELDLGRKAPDHAGAQKLRDSVLESAQGVYHRLDWISQYYETIGDNSTALDYAEKARTALPVTDYTLDMRLLKLYLKTGTYDTSKKEAASELLESLKTSSLWNSEKLIQLAESAQESGYYREAQDWLRTAIAQSPNQSNLRQRKLEMALDSQQDGQIALGIESAMEPPAISVVDSLENSEHILNLIEVTEKLADSGNYEMAMQSLMHVLPEYIQSRGVVTTRRVLKSYAQIVKGYAGEVSSLIAKQDLMGDTPCRALDEMENLSDPKVWARISLKCPQARDNIYLHLREMRSGTDQRFQDVFDEAYYETLVSLSHIELAEEYARTMGINPGSRANFNRSITEGNALDALKNLEMGGLNEKDIPGVIGLLIGLGYTSEAEIYARDHFMEMVPENQTKVAGMMAVLGSKDKTFEGVLTQAESNYSELDGQSLQGLVSVQTLKKWLAQTENANLGTVLNVAIRYAAQNPMVRKDIQKLVNEEIEKRSGNVMHRISAAQFALDEGLYEFGTHQIEQAQKSLPTSEYVCQLHSVLLAKLGKNEEVIRELDRGAGYTSRLPEYWLNTWNAHEKSDISIRRHILEKRLEILPRNPDLMVQKTAILLESGDLQSASETANLAFNYGGEGIVSELAPVYENSGNLQNLPEFENGTTSRDLELKAHRSIVKNELGEAANYYIESARKSPWPVGVYIRGIEQMLEHNSVSGAEQLVARFGEDWPHSYMADAYRCIYEYMNGNIESAWKSYELARTRAFDSNPWVVRIVLAAAQKNDLDFAQKLYTSERELGSLDVHRWLSGLAEFYMNGKESQKAGLSEEAFAARGIEYIENLIPNAVYIGEQNIEVGKQLYKLAVRSQRTDWILRLGSWMTMQNE